MLLFPTIALFGSVISRVNAGPMVPEPDPKNGWHWGVDEGDIMMFEIEFIVSNFTTKEIITMYKNIFIWNISSIDNVTGAPNFLWTNQNFSQITIDVLWENPVGQLENSGNSIPMGYFGYNSTHPIKEKYHGGYSVIPMIFPLNDTTLDISLMADIVNETFFDPMYKAGFTNNFDNYWVDVGQTKLYFEHTDGYFIDASYYANNGTIKDAKAYYLMNTGPLRITFLP